MNVNQLTVREQLIERILHMTDEQVKALIQFADDMEGPMDPAIIEAVKDEPTVSLEDYLAEHKLTPEKHGTSHEFTLREALIDIILYMPEEEFVRLMRNAESL